jgi:hypothetical protein
MAFARVKVAATCNLPGSRSPCPPTLAAAGVDSLLYHAHVWYHMTMDAPPTIYNRAVRCGRVYPLSAYYSGGAAVTIDVTAIHSDADQPPPDPVHLGEEGRQTISVSVPCRSTRDLHAFTASGEPVIYRIRAYHPGDQTPIRNGVEVPVLLPGTRAARSHDDERPGSSG